MQTYHSFHALSENYQPRAENKWLTRGAYAVIAFTALYFGGHIIAALVW